VRLNWLPNTCLAQLQIVTNRFLSKQEMTKSTILAGTMEHTCVREITDKEWFKGKRKKDTVVFCVLLDIFDS
jgi:hypothetical protein